MEVLFVFIVLSFSLTLPFKQVFKTKRETCSVEQWSFYLLSSLFSGGSRLWKESGWEDSTIQGRRKEESIIIFLELYLWNAWNLLSLIKNKQLKRHWTCTSTSFNLQFLFKETGKGAYFLKIIVYWLNVSHQKIPGA